MPATSPAVRDSATATVGPARDGAGRPRPRPDPGPRPSPGRVGRPALLSPVTAAASPGPRGPLGPLALGPLAGPAQGHRPGDVVGAGDHGDHDGDGHHDGGQGLPAAVQRQQVEPDRDRLQDGLDLAAAAGRHHAVPDHDEAQRRDAELADQDDDGDPPGQLAQPGQADQRRADQRLVGDRVDDLADVGDQAAAAGELAVEPVGQRGDAKTTVAATRQPPWCPPSCSSSTAKTGTSSSRTKVSALAMFQTLTPGRRRCGDRVAAVAAAAPAAPRRPARSSPRRLRPGHQVDTLAATTAARTSSPDRRGRPGPAQQPGDAVDVRALVQRPALGRSPSSSDALDQDLDRLADPLLGPLGGQLLDQVADLGGTRAAISAGSSLPS